MATQIPKLNEDLDVIAKLGDNPNTDDGLSASELKAQFDKGPNIIKKFINDYIVPAINNYVIGAGFLSLSGGTMNGNISMKGNKISGLADPTDNQDAATKSFVGKAVSESGFLPKSGGAMTGDIDMSGRKIVGLGEPAAPGDVVTKAFLEGYIVPKEQGGTGAQSGSEGLKNLLAAGYMQLSSYQIVTELPDPATLPEGAFFVQLIQKVE